VKLILTGGAGFIGSSYLWKLNSLGIEDVLVVDTQPNTNAYANLRKKIFRDYIPHEGLLEALKKGKLKEMDGIIHMGACSDTTEKDWFYLEKNNVHFSRTLARWCLENNKLFHYASSASIYGDGNKGYDDDETLHEQYKPLNLYGRSKWMFDNWIISEHLQDRVVGFRYFNVFGPNEYHKGEMRSMVVKAFDQIYDTGHVKLFKNSRNGHTDGSEERDFIYIKDVLEVMAYFLQNPKKNGIYNLGTGQSRTFKDLVTAVFTALKKNPSIDYVPMPEALRGHYQYYTQAVILKLRSAGYTKEFTSIEESIADYVNNFLVKADPYL